LRAMPLPSFFAAFPPPPLPGWALPLLGFAVGLCLGSFATALSWRRPQGISIILPPSRCPACGARLTAGDLVPLLSWLASRGHCRHCGTRVSKRYPLTELAAGIAGGLIAGLSPSLLLACLLLLALPLLLTALVIRIESGKTDWPLAGAGLLPVAVAIVASLI